MFLTKCNTLEELKKEIPKWPPIVSVDTEYSELNHRKAELLSISIGSEYHAWIIPARLVEHLYPLKKSKLIFFQNYVVDHDILLRHGLDLTNTPFLDTMLMEHLIDENLDHGLGDMAKRYFDDDYKDKFWAKYDSFSEAPEHEADDYEMRDAIYTYRLGKLFVSQLSGKSDLIQHVHNLAKALHRTEQRGVKVNEEKIRQVHKEMSDKIQNYLPRLRERFAAECNLFELTKWSEELGKRKTEKGRLGVKKPTFNFDSATNIQWLLYDAIRCPVIEKTKGGKPSTDYDTVAALARSNHDLDLLVEYKGDKTLFSTFVEGMLERVEEGRIYPRFNVNGTTTGRISHSNPNLGNIPREGPIRSFFVPDSGMVLVGADYSQLEVVVEYALTGDEQLKKIITEGASKHDITAQGLGISRDKAKTLNFALQYGAGVHKVSTLLEITHAEAQQVYDKYWKLYSGVSALREQTAKALSESGAVTNCFGRVRHFPKARNEYEKAKQERQAYNFLIQGVGADLCNRAFYTFSQSLKKGQAILSVHDEILAQVETGYEEEAKALLASNMIGAGEFIKTPHPLILSVKTYGPFSEWRKT